LVLLGKLPSFTEIEMATIYLTNHDSAEKITAIEMQCSSDASKLVAVGQGRSHAARSYWLSNHGHWNA
jgi:hypothetical protein